MKFAKENPARSEDQAKAILVIREKLEALADTGARIQLDDVWEAIKSPMRRTILPRFATGLRATNGVSGGDVMNGFAFGRMLGQISQGEITDRDASNLLEVVCSSLENKWVQQGRDTTFSRKVVMDRLPEVLVDLAWSGHLPKVSVGPLMEDHWSGQRHSLALKGYRLHNYKPAMTAKDRSWPAGSDGKLPSGEFIVADLTALDERMPNLQRAIFLNAHRHYVGLDINRGADREALNHFTNRSFGLSLLVVPQDQGIVLRSDGDLTELMLAGETWDQDVDMISEGFVIAGPVASLMDLCRLAGISPDAAHTALADAEDDGALARYDIPEDARIRVTFEDRHLMGSPQDGSRVVMAFGNGPMPEIGAFAADDPDMDLCL